MCDDSIQLCGTMHSQVRRDSFIWVSWLIYVRVTWLVSFMCVPSLTDVLHYSFIWLAGPISKWLNSFTCVEWLICVRGMPRCFNSASIWMSHFTNMDESCHKWTSHVTYRDESCHTYRWVVWQIWASHVTHMDESCHTYECVMSHMWMRHVSHVDASCHTLECV